jgi:hypothetical protein
MSAKNSKISTTVNQHFTENRKYKYIFYGKIIIMKYFNNDYLILPQKNHL